MNLQNLQTQEFVIFLPLAIKANCQFAIFPTRHIEVFTGFKHTIEKNEPETHLRFELDFELVMKGIIFAGWNANIEHDEIVLVLYNSNFEVSDNLTGLFGPKTTAIIRPEDDLGRIL